jgi:hypothetical protein
MATSTVEASKLQIRCAFLPKSISSRLAPTCVELHDDRRQEIVLISGAWTKRSYAVGWTPAC